MDELSPETKTRAASRASHNHTAGLTHKHSHTRKCVIIQYGLSLRDRHQHLSVVQAIRPKKKQSKRNSEAKNDPTGQTDHLRRKILNNTTQYACCVCVDNCGVIIRLINSNVYCLHSNSRSFCNLSFCISIFPVDATWKMPPHFILLF